MTPKGNQFEFEVITRGNGGGINADISPDGNWLAISFHDGVAVIDLQTGEDVTCLKTWRLTTTGGSIYTVRFSHDGGRIAIGGHSGNQVMGYKGFISVWRTSEFGMFPSKQ